MIELYSPLSLVSEHITIEDHLETVRWTRAAHKGTKANKSEASVV